MSELERKPFLGYWKVSAFCTHTHTHPQKRFSLHILLKLKCHDVLKVMCLSGTTSDGVSCIAIPYFRHLAHGSSMRTSAKMYQVPELATGRSIKQTYTTLYPVLKPLYLPDMTAGRWREITTHFENLWQLRNCTGKHVYIEAQGKSGAIFCPYKGRLASLLLTVCDAKYRFTLVDIGEGILRRCRPFLEM